MKNIIMFFKFNSFLILRTNKCFRVIK